MPKKRKKKIDSLISRLRHKGIGSEDFYEEMAGQLAEDHTFNKVFHEFFVSESLAESDADRLRRFYEDFQDGAFEDDEDRDD